MLLIDKTLAERITYYRKKRKLTQAKLSSITGLGPMYLSNLETGRQVPSIHSLARLAAGLGVSIDELVGRH